MMNTVRPFSTTPTCQHITDITVPKLYKKLRVSRTHLLAMRHLDVSKIIGST